LGASSGPDCARPKFAGAELRQRGRRPRPGTIRHGQIRCRTPRVNSSGVSAGGLPDFDIEPSPSTRESSGQEVGAAVQLQATAPSTPPLLQGAYTDLAELNADHISELFSAYGAATDATDWTYLPYGPFADERAFAGELERLQAEPGACYFAVLDGAGKAIGLLGLINV